MPLWFQILAATLARLPEQMAALLPGLSVYRRPFSRAGAAAMGSEEVTVAALRKLVKRLILQAKRQQVGDERIWLFEFQPLVQRYLQAQATGEAHWRAIAYYQSIKSPILSATNKPEATTATDKLEATIPYQEIFHHYCELGEYAIALDFIRTQTDEEDRYSSCDMVLQLSGYNATRLSQYERLTQQWQPNNDEGNRLFSDALQAQGDVLQFLDRRDEAIANYAAALAIYRQVGARLGEANTLQAQGLLQADAQQGVAYLQLAQTLYEQIGSLYGQGVNLFYLGQRYGQLQQSDASIAAFQAAASLGEQIDFAPLVEFAQKAIEEL
ncbi:MAG: hypothetical protein WA885_25100 [Phormidesmis sp.]